LTDNLAAGINLKSIGEKIIDEKAEATTVDLGTLFKYPLEKSILQFGMSVSPRSQMRDDEDTTGAVRLGAAYIKDMLTISGEFNKNLEADGADHIKFGGEYWISSALAPRVGFKGGSEEGNRITFGLGLKLKGLYFDYAACPNEILGSTHKVAVGFKFGYEEGKTKKPLKAKKATKVTVAKKIKKDTGTTLKIAVADLDGKNVSAMDAAIVSDFIRTELVKTQAFTVLDRQNMERILEEQSFQLTGCTTEECAVQMGKILNVSYMAVGTFSKFLETYYINVNFIDVETGEIVGAETAECASGRELPVAAQDLATKLAEQFGQ
jgi:TolB-like protein